MNIIKYNKKLFTEAAECLLALLHFIHQETKDPYFDLTPHDEKTMLKIFKKKLHKKNCTTYLAMIDNQVAGIISGQIIDCFIPIQAINNVGYISAAYVKPQFRRLGIMRALEAKMVDFFKNKNIKYSELNLITGNVPAEKNWAALGYTTFRAHLRKNI